MQQTSRHRWSLTWTLVHSLIFDSRSHTEATWRGCGSVVEPVASVGTVFETPLTRDTVWSNWISYTDQLRDPTNLPLYFLSFAFFLVSSRTLNFYSPHLSGPISVCLLLSFCPPSWQAMVLVSQWDAGLNKQLACWLNPLRCDYTWVTTPPHPNPSLFGHSAHGTVTHVLFALLHPKLKLFISLKCRMFTYLLRQTLYSK